MSIVRQNAITHVVFMVDASGSMRGRENDVVAVIDGQNAWLAKRSADMGHETRVSVYFFNVNVAKTIQCPIFDMDVLRVPSVKDLYRPNGGTALIDATLLAIDELSQTFQKRGQHSFLLFAITDGDENSSEAKATALNRVLTSLGDQWTVAALVPNVHGKLAAEQYGFPKNNIEIWDTNSDTGVAEAGAAITGALDSYMTSRSAGVTGTRTLFAAPVTKAAVDASGMKPLDPSQFFIIPVANDGTMTVHKSGKPTRKNPDRISCLMISDFVRATGRPYEIGKAYYELMKSERIQANKDIAVVDRLTKQVYMGAQARQLIGLPNVDCRIRPLPKDASGEPPYKVYVRSDSVNRHLPIGTTLLLLK